MIKIEKSIFDNNTLNWNQNCFKISNFKNLIKIDNDLIEKNEFEKKQINDCEEFILKLNEEIDRIECFYKINCDLGKKKLKKINLLIFNKKTSSFLEKRFYLHRVVSNLNQLFNFLKGLEQFRNFNKLMIQKALDKFKKNLKKISNNALIKESTIKIMLKKKTTIENQLLKNFFCTNNNLITCLNTIRYLLSKFEEMTGITSILINENQFFEKSFMHYKDILIIDKYDYKKIDYSFKNLNFSFKTQFKTEIKEIILAYKLVLIDDSKNLKLYIDRSLKKDHKSFMFFIYYFVKKSVIFSSLKCIDLLLTLIFSNKESLNKYLMNESNRSGNSYNFQQFIFHEIVSEFSMDFKKNIQLMSNLNKIDQVFDKNFFFTEKGIINFFEFCDKKEDLEFKKLLIFKDSFNRIPLYIACKNNLDTVVVIILKYMKKWNLINDKISIDHLEYCAEFDSFTPLQISIMEKNLFITEKLLEFFNSALCYQNHILTASRLNSIELLELLICKFKFDINFTDDSNYNKTALYFATENNREDIVKFLISKNANTEIKDFFLGWTPIFIACNQGNFEIVEILLNANCRIDIFDNNGFLPIEIASLNGHLKIVEQLMSHYLKTKNEKILEILRIPTIINKCSNKENKKILMDDDFNYSNKLKCFKKKKNSIIEKNKNKNALIVTLESHKIENNSFSFLNVDQKIIEIIKDLKSQLFLIISCKDTKTSLDISVPKTINLCSNEIFNDFSFFMDNDDESEILLTFEIVFKLNVKNRNKLLYKSVCFLNNENDSLGKNLQQLEKTIEIPLLNTINFENIGAIKFKYFFVKKFYIKDCKIINQMNSPKIFSMPKLIGHRGFGMNLDKKLIQVEENTHLSFETSHNMGVFYVETDVQLTKDLVPVIYHDTLCSELGVDIPIHEIKLNQFLALNEEKTKFKNLLYSKKYNFKNKRSMSLLSLNQNSLLKEYDIIDQSKTTNSNNTLCDVYSRMKYTDTWESKNESKMFTGSFVLSDFVSLEKVLNELPQNLHLNIELKYPTSKELGSANISNSSIDLNIYVDKVLNDVFTKNKFKRNIIFSSYNSKICILTKRKQNAYPVLLLTDSIFILNIHDVNESMYNAKKFAKKWNLNGIITYSKILIQTPRLINFIKKSGLKLFVYGVENEDIIPDLLNSGIDSIICDKRSSFKNFN